MTPSLRLRMILKHRAVVQDPAIVDEEHLSRFQVKLRSEFGAAQHAVQYIQGLDLGRSQRLLRLLLADLNPVAQVPADQPATVPGENGEPDGRRLARLDSTAAVDVKRLSEDFQNIRTLFRELGMDSVAANDLVKSAGPGRLQAKQAHVIGERGAERVVCMKSALGVGDGEAGPVPVR